MMVPFAKKIKYCTENSQPINLSYVGRQIIFGEVAIDNKEERSITIEMLYSEQHTLKPFQCFWSQHKYC